MNVVDTNFLALMIGLQAAIQVINFASPPSLFSAKTIKV